MDRVSGRTLAMVLENAGVPRPALDFALSDLPGVAAWLSDRDAFLPAAICVEILVRVAPLVNDLEELSQRERLGTLPESERLALEGVLEAFAQRCSSGRGGAVVDLFEPSKPEQVMENIVIQNVVQHHPGVTAPLDEKRGKPRNTMLGLDGNDMFSNITFRNCRYVGRVIKSLDDGDFRTNEFVRDITFEE